MRRAIDLDSVVLGAAIQTPRPWQLGIDDEGQTRKRTRIGSKRASYGRLPVERGKHTLLRDAAIVAAILARAPTILRHRLRHLIVGSAFRGSETRVHRSMSFVTMEVPVSSRIPCTVEHGYR